MSMKRLTERIETAKGDPVRLFVLRSAIVPKQRLHLECPKAFAESLLVDDDTFVCVGRFRTPHKRGVAVKPELVAKRADGRADVILTAGDACEIVSVGLAEDLNSALVMRDARVKWLSLDELPDENATRNPSSRLQGQADALEPLVDEWLLKVRGSGRERFQGHLDAVLQDLGPMPSAERPNERCLWIAGLLCPEPPLGVANDVRAQVLLAETAEDRVALVEMGLLDSIARLEVDWV